MAKIYIDDTPNIINPIKIDANIDSPFDTAKSISL